MWHQKFFDNIRDMGSWPCYSDFDLWIIDRGDYYEYIAVMVDDILIFSKYPHEIIGPIQDIWKYELKGVRGQEYGSGADIGFNEERKFWNMLAKTYIKSVFDQIYKILVINLKNYVSPLDAGDHP